MKGYNSTDILSEFEDLFTGLGCVTGDRSSDSSSQERSSGPEKDTERDLKCIKR